MLNFQDEAGSNMGQIAYKASTETSSELLEKAKQAVNQVECQREKLGDQVDALAPLLNLSKKIADVLAGVCH